MVRPYIGSYWPISEEHLILALANLQTHNNLWLRYYVQVISPRLK